MLTCFKHLPRNFPGSFNSVFKFYFRVNSSLGEWNRAKQDSLNNTQINQEQKRFSLKLLRNSLDTVDFKNITVEDGKLLLQYCGSFTIDSSRKLRNELCQKIFDNLSKHSKLDYAIYHTYIKTCTDNAVSLNSNEFLMSLACKPDEKIYKLLLENTCENGKVEEAFVLLEMLKKEGYSVDEEVFASLLLVHTLIGGLKAADTVLLTMKTAHVPETSNTKLALLKGVLRRNDYEDFQRFLLKYPFDLNENQLLSILEVLGLIGNISWLQEMKVLYGTLIISREFVSDLKKVCTHLVHMNKSKNAMAIFENFVPYSTEENYGDFILEEMLHCNVDIEEITSLSRYLCENEINLFAFEHLTELALKNLYVDAAWTLLGNLRELRPHYFWPLLVIAHKTNGEKGVFEVLQRMINMHVKPDPETLESYFLPFCNPDDPTILIQKLTNLGFSVRQVLSSVLLFLLQGGKIKEAAALCDSYKVQIHGGDLFSHISVSWNLSKNSQAAVKILQKYCESCKTENDLVGDFLVRSLDFCKTSKDYEHFNELLKLLEESKLKITTTSANILYNTLTKCEDNISQDIQKNIDALLDFREKPESSYIPHPRDMTVDELECHLLELQEKNKETRGVLRKLIQVHSNLGNYQRAEQLRQVFLEAGYAETLGMKSSVMHNYVLGGHLEPAMQIYREIKTVDPKFTIDSFKILDLATLLVKDNRFAEAMNILREASESKRKLGGPGVQRNCLELLKAFKDEQEQRMMYNLLIDKGWCKVNNVILGPLVRIHLNSGNLEQAVTIYTELSKQYKCTPLQLELIRDIVKTENGQLLQKVLDSTVAIHGNTSTQAALIAALAENGQEKALNKLFSTNKLLVREELEKRCQRWIKERKVKALETLAKSCERVHKEVFDVNYAYHCIMTVHSVNNDCESAVNFYENLLQNDVLIARETEDMLVTLLRHNNYSLPNSLKIKNRK